MEDIRDLVSSSASNTGHNTSLSSHSLDSPLLPSSASSSSATSPLISSIPQTSPKSSQSKHLGSNRSLSIDYGASNNVTVSSMFPTRSVSFDVNSSGPNNIASHRQNRVYDVDEALSSQQATPFIDVSHYSSPPPTPSTHRSSIHSSRREKSQQQRKSIDLGYNMMQASLRRLRRSPSLWTTGDRPLTVHDARDRHIHNLRAEPQLSDQQKLVALRRARKIVQVFGSEAPVDVVHGNGHIHCHSTDRRDSLSTIVSADVHPSIGSIRRRSNSDSSLFVETSQSWSTSLDRSNTPSDMAPDIEETPSPFFPSSSFSERRRRAAKLTHFFGVSCQDIPQSIGQKFLPSSCTDDNINNPAVEVDIKVVGRRFLGMSVGQTKTADVADVIGKLRGLRAG
ncbi:hypothetical protein H2248_000684 [Termitomyces sp. 'cryptogamus']|nr:hypothetical protein H2248_000684 [Termitomyces sp. 'cryptogamus']